MSLNAGVAGRVEGRNAFKSLHADPSSVLTCGRPFLTLSGSEALDLATPSTAEVRGSILTTGLLHYMENFISNQTATSLFPCLQAHQQLSVYFKGKRLMVPSGGKKKNDYSIKKTPKDTHSQNAQTTNKTLVRFDGPYS